MDTWHRKLSGLEIDNYRLTEYVGRGRTGVVYKAHDKTVADHCVAIKITPGQPRSGFKTELYKVAKLSGVEGVVQFHGLASTHLSKGPRTEVALYTVWDFIPPGRNLKQYLQNSDEITTSFYAAVATQVLRVLHACSVRGVARHGDLHPGNILIGERDPGVLDEDLKPSERIFISDFGYGTSGTGPPPKDDYEGLASILNLIRQRIPWPKASASDKHILLETPKIFSKALKEEQIAERASPLEILRALKGVIDSARSGSRRPSSANLYSARPDGPDRQEVMAVGAFQVSEMLGENWDRWRQLFVPSVPARSSILTPDIATVVTGPRGCGKTMLFRRLSERLLLECGPVEGFASPPAFLGLYVNANDVADAFPGFPSAPERDAEERLTCYMNIAFLADLLAVQSSRCALYHEEPPAALLDAVALLLSRKQSDRLPVAGEDKLEQIRSNLELLKWEFPSLTQRRPTFRGFDQLARHNWLPRFLDSARSYCPWIAERQILLFVDDYTTPRVSRAMQRVCNRILFHRTSQFVVKIATEAAMTFLPEDSSGKVLQDGDDYRLVDMAEEALFMSEPERQRFLGEVFRRRLALDIRTRDKDLGLPQLLGSLGLKKTEFARRLREPSEAVSAGQRRGATKPRALYHGHEVFALLWSGDTRTLIQLVQYLLDDAEAAAPANEPGSSLPLPIEPELQDRVLRNRGGQWLENQTRNQPTDPAALDAVLNDASFGFAGGSFGTHLKAIVEAFVLAARNLLLGPTYKDGKREVPRMAHRIEIVDEFRLDGIEALIYHDLIRYGLFLRDARGKSVRGAMVPRLYLRRFLLPYCTLALSIRDSVQMTCEDFRRLLLSPDEYRARIEGSPSKGDANQLELFSTQVRDPRYDDLEPGEIANTESQDN